MISLLSSHRRGGLSGVGRAAVVPPAAFAVHQLRYLLAYGSAGGAELQRQGHSYLHSAVPWIILVLGLVVGGFLSSLGRAMRGRLTPTRYGLSLLGLWLVCSVGLVAIYTCQELLEGIFATGHPGGLIGVFGFGGWWAVPAAACVGLVLATLLHGARWLLGEAAAWSKRNAHRGSARQVRVRRPAVIGSRQRSALARGWCDRGPPHSTWTVRTSVPSEVFVICNLRRIKGEAFTRTHAHTGAHRRSGARRAGGAGGGACARPR